ncbi:unnamed protein product, partial [Aphanomyces euteiches]
MFTSIPTFLLALTSIALGHGYLNDPLPTYFPGTKDVTSFCGTMDSPKVLPGHQYKGSPEYNANAFTIHFKASTLKALVAANDGGCVASGWQRVLAHGQEGFTPSHEGPCEVWCDNTRVYQNDDCARNIPNGTMPIDLPTCKKSNLLTVYWLALHSPTWQIYINCVRIAGGAAPSPSSASPPSNPTSKSPCTNSPPTPPPATPSPPSNGQVQVYYPCGGQGYTGPTQCASGLHCHKWSVWHSQCVPSVNTWGQCGGSGFQGPTVCKTSDVCKIHSE